MHDNVSNPKHYATHPSGVECIEIDEHMDFCLGNAVKYLWRAGMKGTQIEDLRKALWYLHREVSSDKAHVQKPFLPPHLVFKVIPQWYAHEPPGPSKTAILAIIEYQFFGKGTAHLDDAIRNIEELISQLERDNHDVDEDGK